MELLIKNSPNSYDTGDIIDIREDGFEWSTGAMNSSDFSIVYGVTLDAGDDELLKLYDEGITSHSAIGQLPTFRSRSTGRDNLKSLHRRKYQYINGAVTLKSNAQERT